MTDVNTEPVSAVLEPVSVVTEPGSKTDPALLLKATQEEREKRRQAEERARKAEEELAKLTANPSVDAPISDEGKFLASQIDEVKKQLAKEQEEKRLQAVLGTHPALKDKNSEFEAYRSDPNNAGMSIETAAKAFLAENDLLQTQKPRKGLEVAGGSGRNVPQQGMSIKEIDELRVNNFREYSKRIRNGTLNN